MEPLDEGTQAGLLVWDCIHELGRPEGGTNDDTDAMGHDPRAL